MPLFFSSHFSLLNINVTVDHTVKIYCMCILKTLVAESDQGPLLGGRERVFLFVYVLAFDVEFACEVNRGTHPVIRLSKGQCAPAASSSEDRVQSR